LIGLAVIIAVIVWAFSGDFLSDQTEDVVEDAYNALICSSDINIETNLCYVDSNTLRVSLKNRGSVDIPNLRIVVSSSSESEIFEDEDYFLESYVRMNFDLDLTEFGILDIEELIFVLAVDGVGDCSPGPIGVNADLIEDCHEEIGGGDPEISVTPQNIDYGNVIIEEIVTEIITISNSGNANLQIDNIISDQNVFIVGAYQDNIPVGGSISVGVSFRPREETGYSGTLTVYSSDGDHPSVEVDLLGNGILADVPTIFVEPVLDFGDVYVLEFLTKQMRIKNVGTGTLNIHSISDPGNPFTIEDSGSFDILSGEFEDVAVTFAPTEEDIFVNDLVIHSNSSPSEDHYTDVSLVGESIIEGSISMFVYPNELKFGGEVVGQSSELDLVIVNDGDGILTISGISNSEDVFSFVPQYSFDIPSGDSERVIVTFSPVDEGYVSDNLIISSNAPGGLLNIPLSGTGFFDATYGCTDVNALNYDPFVTESCTEYTHPAECGGDTGPNCCCEYGFIDFTDGDVSLTFEQGDGVYDLPDIDHSTEIRNAINSFVDHLSLSEDGTWMSLVGFAYNNYIYFSLGFDAYNLHDFVNDLVNGLAFGGSFGSRDANLPRALFSNYCLLSFDEPACQPEHYYLDRDDSVHPDYTVIIMSSNVDSGDSSCSVITEECEAINSVDEDLGCSCHLAMILKNELGIKVITIAVGNVVDHEFLKDYIASPSTVSEIYAYQVDSYEGLIPFFNQFFG